MTTVGDLIDYLQQHDPRTPVVQSEEDFDGLGDVVVLDFVMGELE